MTDAVIAADAIEDLAGSKGISFAASEVQAVFGQDGVDTEEEASSLIAQGPGVYHPRFFFSL